MKRDIILILLLLLSALSLFAFMVGSIGIDRDHEARIAKLESANG